MGRYFSSLTTSHDSNQTSEQRYISDRPAFVDMTCSNFLEVCRFWNESRSSVREGLGKQCSRSVLCLLYLFCGRQKSICSESTASDCPYDSWWSSRRKDTKMQNRNVLLDLEAYCPWWVITWKLRDIPFCCYFNAFREKAGPKQQFESRNRDILCPSRTVPNRNWTLSSKALATTNKRGIVPHWGSGS